MLFVKKSVKAYSAVYRFILYLPGDFASAMLLYTA
jgi:hypothetical protein